MREIRALVVLSGFLAIGSAAAANNPGNTAASTVGSDEFAEAAETAVDGVCAQACHGWENIYGGPRRVPEQWDALVSDMVGRGANGTDEQLTLIRRYLKWSWGMLWINSASAEDIAAVLAVPEKDADAVIAWRDAHGKFADLDSLKEVPGIDPAKIEAQADAIQF